MLAMFTSCGRLSFEEHDAGATPGRDGAPSVDGEGPIVNGAIVVTGLEAEWATPNAVRWRWARAGDAADFDRYELVVGPSPSAVVSRSVPARVFTSADNPELGELTLPTTGGDDPVVASTTDGQLADSDVYAQLWAFDVRGGYSTSAVAQARTTPDASTEVVLFGDADTAGYSIPDTFVRSRQSPFAGTYCYRYQAACVSPSTCYENLRRQAIDVSIASMPAAAFPHAFLEYAIAIDAGDPSWWSDARLAWNVPAYASYHVLPLTYRADGMYRVYQVPLSALVSESDVPLDHATATGSPVYEFWFGGSWASDHAVRVDQVRIRW